MKYAVAIVIVGLLTGCATKQTDAKVHNDTMLNFSVANSKKIELIDPSTTAKTYVMITYLNPIKHALITQESEKFIVGTYMATGEQSTPLVKLANFEVNQLPKEEIKVKHLTFEDPLLALISSANPWTDYLLVEAPKTEDINMTISFENDQLRRVSATFRKDY